MTDAAPPPPRPRSRRRTILFASVLALLVLSPLLVVAGLELVGRWRGGRVWYATQMISQLDCTVADVCRPRPGVAREQDATGRSHVNHINSQGFRSPERPFVRTDPRTLRVAVFGDSFIYGTGVEDDETLPQALAAELGRRFPDRPVEGLNFGRPMNYAASHLRTYDAFARPFTPDAVVFMWHQDSINPHDMNARVKQIRDSWFLTQALGSAPGRWFVERVQYAGFNTFDREEARLAVQAGAGTLASDVAADGRVVAVFAFMARVDQVDRMLPATMPFTVIDSGIPDVPRWSASGFAIPGDGHPNAEGQRHLARVLADGLEAPLRKARP